jgi:O-antigen/teichoic acid export membrane protein
MKIDQVMIAGILNIEEVGVYSIAVRISEAWYFIPTIIVSTLMPYFLSLREKDRGLYKERLCQLLSFMFWLGVLAGVTTFFIGEKAIFFLFGDQYSNAFSALLINIWGGIFIAQGLASSIWMIAENLQIFRVYIQVMAVCANIIFNIILVPILGIAGAAISTFLTYFLATWVFGLLFRDLRLITLMMIKASFPNYMVSYFKRNRT